MNKISFEWDPDKALLNQQKHGVAFHEAQHAFMDEHRIIAEDVAHSASEKRYYCFGQTSNGIMTVRFTYRHQRIRIIGAGYWRKGKQIYEQENSLH